MLMLAFGRGFLAREMSMKQHIVLSILPVVPLKGLPEHLQKRIAAFKASASSWMQLGFWLVVLLTAATTACSLDPDNTSYLVQSARHLAAFVGFMHVLLIGAALIASALGSEPVVNPFNSFWEAESVADWWNYRWNTVVGTSLRCTVYDPIVQYFKMGNPDKPTQLHVKLLAGCATFAYSGFIHEQALINQGAYNAAGPMMAFFMVQPALYMLQPIIADLVSPQFCCIANLLLGKGQKDAVVWRNGGSAEQSSNQLSRSARVRSLIGRATTVSLLGACILSLWCPVFDAPYSDITIRISRAMMRVLPGMLDAVPYCS